MLETNSLHQICWGCFVTPVWWNLRPGIILNKLKSIILSINIFTPRSGFQIITLKSNTCRAPGSPPSEPALCSQFDGSDRFALVTSVGWWKADQWPEWQIIHKSWMQFQKNGLENFTCFPPRFVVNCSQSTFCQTRTYRFHHKQGKEKGEVGNANPEILRINSFLLSLNKLFVCA